MAVEVESRGPMFQLGDNKVQVCLVRSDRVTNPTLLDRYRQLLSVEESERLERFAFQRDRHQFLVGRALLRTMLSCYGSIEPRDWIFETDRFGKPEVRQTAFLPPLRFNLSHSGDVCICAATLRRDLGIDVERIENAVDTDLARRVLSEAELEDTMSRPPDAQSARFFDYWTLKEAYVKARGEGLSIPFKSVQFKLHPEGWVRVSFERQINDRESSWQFRQLAIQEGYKAALAIRVGKAPEIEIRVNEVIPMTGYLKVYRGVRLPVPGSGKRSTGVLRAG